MTRRLAAAAAAVLLSLVQTSCSRRRSPPPITKAEVETATRSPESWLSDEPVQLLRDYVRIDTSLEHGEEKGTEFLRRFFECEGIETEVICPRPTRCNIFARLPGRRREGALLLLNHVDVAPAFPTLWKAAPPFEGRLKAGYLYGRGVYDMKSIAIAQALAMRNLKRHGIVPASDVLFLGEADEEVGQQLGSRWLLEHRPDLFAGVGQVVNEGGVVELVLREPRYWGIETVQAGYATAELEAPTAQPLAALADRWRKLHSPIVEPDPQVVEGFRLLANHLVSPLTDPLRHLDRVRRDPAELAILPDRYGSFLEARAFWSSPFPVRGDPASPFRIVLVLSTPPGMPPERYFDPILAEARSHGITPVQAFSGGTTTASPYPTPFTETIRRVTEGHFPGVPFGPLPTSGSFSTSMLFRRRGFPTYGFSPIPMNITDASRRHRSHERVYLPDFLAGVRLFRDILEEFALRPGG
jgi:acetylornithine deacetylase/succinyl-diaminopimelate desuccinylase-like protein